MSTIHEAPDAGRVARADEIPPAHDDQGSVVPEGGPGVSAEGQDGGTRSGGVTFVDERRDPLGSSLQGDDDDPMATRPPSRSKKADTPPVGVKPVPPSAPVRHRALASGAVERALTAPGFREDAGRDALIPGGDDQPFKGWGAPSSDEGGSHLFEDPASWMGVVSEALSLSPVRSTFMGTDEAVRFMEGRFPHVEAGLALKLMKALQGYTSVRLVDQLAVEIDAPAFRLWVAEAERQEAHHRDRVEVTRMVGQATSQRVVEETKGLKVVLSIVGAVIVLGFLSVMAWMIQDGLRIRREMDEKATEIGFVTTPDGVTVPVTTADQVFEAAGLSNNSAVRDVQVAAGMADLTHRVNDLEGRKFQVEQDLSTTQGKLASETTQRTIAEGSAVRAETAAEDAKKAAKEAADAAKVLAQEVGLARNGLVEQVRSGQCGATPTAQARGEWQFVCASTTATCNAPRPTDVTRCRFTATRGR